MRRETQPPPQKKKKKNTPVGRALSPQALESKHSTLFVTEELHARRARDDVGAPPKEPYRIVVEPRVGPERGLDAQDRAQRDFLVVLARVFRTPGDAPHAVSYTHLTLPTIE